MNRNSGWWVAMLVVVAGCQPQVADTASSSPAPANAAEPPAPISTPATRIGGLELNPLSAQAQPARTQPVTSTEAPVPAATPPMERSKAQAGDGIKGQSLKQHTGVVVEPLKAFIRFEQKAVYQLQIPEALKLFNATEGRNPRSHDEFMARIIAANQIQLPRLPEGHRYIYDPARNELMVERPAQ